MSLNTAHTDGGIVIHAGEVILLHAASTVLSFSGSDDLKKCTDLLGNSYLTTHRLIFLTKGSKSFLKSFSFPYCVMSQVDVEQPVFGANALRGKVRAQPNGNWAGEAKFKIQFKSGGAIEFATGMMKAVQLARQMSSQNPYWDAPPPAYEAATFMPAPGNYYAPPTSYCGWMPPAYNFPPPEAGTVFVTEAPPPYPGLGLPGGVPAQGNTGGFGGYPQQPGMYQQQPGMYPQPQQPAMYQQQPGMYQQQPGMYQQQPGMYQEQPGMYPQPQQPAMYQQQPGMGMYDQQAAFAPLPQAYANGQQAYVPPTPPPYEYPTNKVVGNKKQD